MTKMIYNQYATADDIAEFVHQNAQQNNGNVNLKECYDEMRKNPNYKLGYTKFEKLALEVMSQNNYKKIMPSKPTPAQRMPIPKQTSGSMSRSSSKSDISAAPISNFDSSDFDPVEPRFAFDDVGGLDFQKSQLQETILLPLLHPSLFKSAGAMPTRGILISGPPGCGKSLLAEATAGQFAQNGINFFRIAATDLLKSSSGFSGSTIDRVKALFKAATTLSPSLILLDDIDDISKGAESNPARTSLANCIDQISNDLEHYIAVIATTSKIEKVNSIFRRPGRFGKEISIGLPDHDQRLAILQVVAKKINLDDDVDLEMISREADGFIGADIVSLSQEASLTAVKRVISGTQENLDELEVKVTNDDFLNSIRLVQPTLRREGFITLPPASFNDIGGLDDVKRELQVAVIDAIIRPDVFEMYGHRSSAGVILYGPPGCGKTLLARAIAHEANRAAFISVKGPELLNKFLGESESAVRSVFRRARDSAPCVIFFDEIDSICPRRSDDSSNAAASRVVNQLLTEMDGVADRGRVFVIGATNRLELIDEAMLRPGRLDKKIEVPLPDKNGRIQILERHISRINNHEEIDIESIADKTEYFSGADLDALTSEAIEAAILESQDDQWVPVQNKHYENALIKMLQVKESMEMSKQKKILQKK